MTKTATPLDAVAAAYLRAVDAGARNPVKVVATALHITPAAAKGRVTKARQLGMLPPHSRSSWPDDLDRVAVLYGEAIAAGRRDPTAAVAAGLGVSHSTAGWRVRVAHAAGLLPDVERLGGRPSTLLAGRRPIVWREALNDYASWAHASGHAVGTLKIRCSYLIRFAGLVPDPWAVTFTDLVSFLSSPDWRPNTRRSARAALRSFYGWAVLADHLDKDPTDRLPRTPVRAGLPRPTPREVVQDALAIASDDTRLMILLAVLAGLRRAEVARVHSRDVDDRGGLTVHGKGDRTRRVPLSPMLAAALAERPAGYVFPGAVDGHLSADRVGHVLAEALGDGWTAHTLRHRFATTGYARDRDLLAMQKLLGHAKPETAAIYILPPDDALRRAVEAAAAATMPRA